MKALVLTLVLALLLQGAPLAAADLSLEIPSSVQGQGGTIVLGDAARIEGRDDLVRKVSSLSLQADDEGRLSRQSVIDALQEAGIGGIKLRIVMAESVDVAGVGTTAALVKALAGWPWGLEASPVDLPPGAQPQGAPTVRPGDPSMTLRLRLPDGSERALPVRLTWYQPAPVAVRSLQRGQIIDSSDLTLRTVRRDSLKELPFSAENLLGCRLVRDVPAGSPLARSDFEILPLVERRDRVVLRARSGSLVVAASAQALDSGALGETVRVRNLESRTIVDAVVVGPGVVEAR
jgi:flagella basal body P-ring formation protein FlgA